MILAKSYETVFKFVKVMHRKLVASFFWIRCIMAGCQAGWSPSMLAAHYCILIIADNTNKGKREQKT